MTSAAHEAPAAITSKLTDLTDEALCLAWEATEGKPVTQELALVRGWLMTELEQRLGEDAYDAWLMAANESPLAYFPTA